MQSVTELKNWIGREEIRNAVIDLQQVELIAATLGASSPKYGASLPGLWHWCWFNDVLASSELGRDGHPKLGKYLPPVPLPRRMWAGGSFEFFNPVEIGKKHQRRTTIKDIQQKDGRSGQLYIVNVEHEISCQDILCLREQQNLVYREDPDANAPQPSPSQPPSNPEMVREFLPDSVLMFRYSALTFNGHRIHYDVDYAREVEGYRGLVFHAPLTATMLFQLANDMVGEKVIQKYSYRATTPLFCNEVIKLCGRCEADRIIVWAENHAGDQAMIGEAELD